jgi:hypothetical protein
MSFTKVVLAAASAFCLFVSSASADQISRSSAFVNDAGIAKDGTQLTSMNVTVPLRLSASRKVSSGADIVWADGPSSKVHRKLKRVFKDAIVAASHDLPKGLVRVDVVVKKFRTAGNPEALFEVYVMNPKTRAVRSSRTLRVDLGDGRISTKQAVRAMSRSMKRFFSSV